jgi:hypothetical protein
MVLAEHLFEFEQADPEAPTERTIAVGVGEAL